MLGYNTTYVIEVEGLKIGHLGNIGHSLTDAQSEALEGVDILLAPVGGDEGLTYDKAAELVTELDAQGRDPHALRDRDRRQITGRCRRHSARSWVSKFRKPKTSW